MVKDFGVLVDYKLSGSKQCQASASKANIILACIKKCIYSRDKLTLLFRRLDPPTSLLVQLPVAGLYINC